MDLSGFLLLLVDLLTKSSTSAGSLRCASKGNEGTQRKLISHFPEFLLFNRRT